MRAAPAFVLGAVVLVGLALTAPELAHASSCGGGGSSGGGSSSGGGGGGGGGDDDGCVDKVDIVGYRKCTEFGAWASNLHLPRVFVQVGMAMRQSPSLAGGRTGHLEHDGESFQYRTLQPPAGGLGEDLALVTTARLGIGLPRGLYVAVEGEVGPLLGSAAAAPQMTTAGALGTPTIEQGRGIVVNATAIVGVAAKSARGLVGVEAAAGVRSVNYMYESQYLACETISTISAAASLAEVRARGEYWLGPFVTIGATVGASVIDRGSWIGGIHIGFHSRAYAGGR